MSADSARYIAALVIATIATSLSDWYFMGVLFHDRYLAHPEVWRHTGDKRRESLAVAWSALLGLLSAAVFLYLSLMLGMAASSRVFTLALGIWLIGPVPLQITQALFVKVHFLNTLASLLGWLVRLLICAVVARLVLR